MQEVFDKFGTIVAFLVICILIQTMLGNDILNQFLLLVLLSIILLNANDFIKMLGGI